MSKKNTNTAVEITAPAAAPVVEIVEAAVVEAIETTPETSTTPAPEIVAEAPKAKVTMRDRVTAGLDAVRANMLNVAATVAVMLVLAGGISAFRSAAIKAEKDQQAMALQIIGERARQSDEMLKLETRKVEAIEASTAGIGTRLYKAGESVGTAVSNLDGRVSSFAFGEGSK
jgi:uncharacterized protein HemX